MSKTTCICAITEISNISEGTVNKLYNQIGTPQPCSVNEDPIPYYQGGCRIEHTEVLVNSTIHAKDRNDADVISYYIMPSVYVVYNKID